MDITAMPDKFTLIESSSDLGLYSRFAAGSLATTDAILHTDDDLGVPEDSLEALYSAWRDQPRSCHGLYGRTAHEGYGREDAFGKVEILLTRAVMCSRSVNNAALAATPHFDDLTSIPAGNGEDIILSFAAMAASGSLNNAYPLASEDYPGAIEANLAGDVSAIHLRWPDHFAHRERVVARCRQVFFPLGSQRPYRMD